MVDKSWGVPKPATPGTGSQDAGRHLTSRTADREARLAERAALLARRQEARIDRREADRQAAEQIRVQRREREQELAAADPHAAAAGRRRGSGRRDVVREQRDTSGYTMIVDADRIRTLAARGASTPSLAAAFGLSEDDVHRVLAEASS